MRDFETVRNEGADEIAKDSMPETKPTESQLKAQELGKKYVAEVRDERRAEIEKDPEVKAKLEEAFDQALNEIMLDDDLSAHDGGAGEAFYKAAQAEKPGYVKFLMNEMVNKNLDAEQAITTAGQEYMSRLENRAS